MRHIQIIVLATALVGACNSKSSEPGPAPAPSPKPASAPAPEPSKLTPAPAATAGYKLVETDSDDPSCVGHKLVDGSGHDVKLPDGLSLDCFASLSPDGRLVFHQKGLELRYYDITAGKDERAVLFEDGLEGTDGMSWSPDGARVALIAVNQKIYPQRTRLFVWSVAGGALADKQRLDLAIGFECGSQCMPFAWAFKDARTIEYTTRGADRPDGAKSSVTIN